MSEQQPTPEELDAQIQVRRSRFQSVLEDIRAVLREDIAVYVPRETKRSFLAAPEVSDDMGAARVAELKERAAALGKELAATVDEALSDTGVWTGGAGELPDNRRDITAAKAWEHVRQVETAVHAMLSEFGLGGAEPVTYKPPAYFVKGLYLPSLAEHYWRLVQEIEELKDTKVRIESDAVRARLEAKWDDA